MGIRSPGDRIKWGHAHEAVAGTICIRASWVARKCCVGMLARQEPPPGWPTVSAPDVEPTWPQVLVHRSSPHAPHLPLHLRRRPFGGFVSPPPASPGSPRPPRHGRYRVRLRHRLLRSLHRFYVEGQPARFCSTPLSSVDRKKLTTIEALSQDQCHVVHKAWLGEAVPQCGYCQLGQISRPPRSSSTRASPPTPRSTRPGRTSAAAPPTSASAPLSTAPPAPAARLASGHGKRDLCMVIGAVE